MRMVVDQQHPHRVVPFGSIHRPSSSMFMASASRQTAGA
ncbi:hypothetical protein B8V81_3499 [Paenibacillus pasadenensis]|uniref:Uncharacterized protein n=1 Tax=Paenibacillus pasadenensis TaxID=217090 RepID=A0A2N5N3Z1_9BACL|nr:hypothetical protein B8V81_3499 [Paenibacillus pasadenensis]